MHAGLRSPMAFVLRRCQIVQASQRGLHARLIGEALGCDDQTVRNAIHAFNQHGVAALTPGSSVPHRTPHAVVTPDRRRRLGALLEQSPRTFGESTSVWTLKLVAKIAFAQGITPRLVTAETIRTALAQLGVSWKRAKHWIASPDPAYQEKKSTATD